MSWIELWNGMAERWLGWALSAGVSSALLLALVALVWWGIRRRASAHVGHLLFLLPLVPLVLPRAGWIELRVPAETPALEWLAPEAVHGEDLRESAAAAALPSTTRGGSALASSGQLDASTARRAGFDEAGSSEGSASAERPTAAAWAMLAWAIVAALLFARFLAVQLATHRLVRRASPLCGEEATRVRAALKRLLPRAGLRSSPRLVTSELIASPAVWGTARPTLMLPPGLTARLDDGQLEWVLLHELAHVARRDLAVAAGTRVVQLLWFFHPGVWLARIFSDALRECACDEAALARSSNTPRRRYAEALLEIVALSTTRPTARFALQTLNNETSLMKNRILRLLDPHRTARRGLSWTALALLAPAAFAGLSLAGLEVTRDDPPVVVEEIQDDDEAIEIFEEVDDETPQLADARAAADRGLAWLLEQQREDGHWPTGPETEADTGELNSIGVTGLMVLSLLEAQEREAVPARTAAIERGLVYLESVQDPETNLFGPVRGHRVMASHAMATRAWLRGASVRAKDDWRERAERAVAAILRARNPYAGWRYGPLPEGDNDSFMTSLMLMTLAEARDAGLEVPEQDVAGGLELLDQLTEPSNGRTGYDVRGSLVSRLAIAGDRFPQEFSEMCTSMAILARLDWGQDPLRSEAIRDGASLIVKAPPLWSVARGSIDYYHWWFGTEVLRRLGGYTYDYWRAALLEAVLPNQSPNGSWPAIDAWSVEGTSVHTTVVNVRTLQSVLRQ